MVIMTIPSPFSANDPTGMLSHSDRGPTFVGVSWALTGLATIFLSLRVYCKLSRRRRLWWDDYILIGAWIIIIANDALTTVLVGKYKLGRHSWDLQIDDPVKFTLLLSSRATVTITAIAWTKTAFAVTLLRLTEDWTKKFVWFVLITINIAMGYSAAVPWIQCQPLAKGWNSRIPGACWAPGIGTTTWIITGAYSAAMDFTLAALPWTFLWSLPMRKKEKIGVTLAMSMGIVAGTVAIIKCIKLVDLNSPDAYNAAELYMWDIIESTTTMIAACIPTLRVLIRDVREASSGGLQTSTLEYIPTKSPKVQSKKSFTNIEATEYS